MLRQAQHPRANLTRAARVLSLHQRVECDYGGAVVAAAAEAASGVAVVRRDSLVPRPRICCPHAPRHRRNGRKLEEHDQSMTYEQEIRNHSEIRNPHEFRTWQAQEATGMWRDVALSRLYAWVWGFCMDL